MIGRYPAVWEYLEWSLLIPLDLSECVRVRP